MNPILTVENVTKRFGNVVALKKVSAELRPHEVLGLIGQNGSGKSSLLKVMAGLYRPDEGVLRVSGKTVTTPVEALKAGIGMVHQEQSLIWNMTVSENLFVDKSREFSKLGFYRRRAMNEAARRQLAKVDLDISPETLVGELSFAQRQMVELAKVLTLEELVGDHLVILFDEPTSVLAPSEIQSLFAQIRRLKTRASAVFISHRMDEVLEISDRIYVMSDGNVVAERQKDNTDPDELYELMVGRQNGNSHGKRVNPPSRSTPERLTVDNLNLPHRLNDVSLSVSAGEIVGLVGVQGSGAEEVCRTLFGLEEDATATIRFEGQRVTINRPSDAIHIGLGYLPAERKTEGMLRGRSVLDNIAVTFGSQYGHTKYLLSRTGERRQALDWVLRLKIKTPSVGHSIDKLSGGNQQKVVLSKWLIGKKIKLLMLDHPTRGLDPGARDDLFAVIRAAADQGLSVIFIGDTLDEVLALADVVVAMKDGNVTRRFENVQIEPPHPADIVRAIV